MPYLVLIDKVGKLGEELSPCVVVLVVITEEGKNVVVDPLHLV